MASFPSSVRSIVSHVHLVESALDSRTGDLLKMLGIKLQADVQTSMTPNGPSKPGQPPAVDFGNLHSAIHWQLNNGTNSQGNPGGDAKGATVLQVGVTPSAKYGLWLETGTRRMAARPFLAPAYRRMVAGLQGIVSFEEMALGG